jgi:hypothetical protein
MKPASAIPLLALASQLACGDQQLGREFDVSLTLEDSVTARRSPNEVNVRVSVRLTNNDARTIFYDSCGHALQKRDGANWRTVYSPVCQLTQFSYGLFTGQSHTFTLRVRSNSSTNEWPAVDVEGEYRVVLFLSETPRNSSGIGFRPLGLASRTSPTFFVREELVVF